ncbi:MAG: M81 family metallopeptidase [Pelagimonas sp.]|jgi:microcystin degradation protein MlrC|nr:M81 family metallopeptidase [Pelagimonas sp.]
MPYRVALGGLHTECSTYNPLFQQRADFRRLEGQALLDKAGFDYGAHGIAAIPLFHESSVPGGPVARDVFDAQAAELLQALRDALPLDGVHLLLHGAMFVPGVIDPEGWLITQVRDIVGPGCVIAGSFDLHGQITQDITDTLDIFAAYRTAPHIDVTETHARAAAMLTRALTKGLRPQVARVPVPVLVSGEMSSTFVAPCDRLYASLPQFDRRAGVWDANLMIGYVWADSPRATAAAVVTCLDPAAGAQVAQEIADSYWQARHELVFDMQAMPLADAQPLLDQPLVLADSGDNPTGGGVGDRAEVLAALQQSGTKALFAGIAGPKAYAELEQGAKTVTIGGELGGGGPKVVLDVDQCRFAHDCAIVESAGLTVVISKYRRPFHNFSDFKALGLSLSDHPILVVKSGYLSPDIRTLDRRQIMLLTDGAVNQDITRQQNLNRPRPCFPFQ